MNLVVTASPRGVYVVVEVNMLFLLLFLLRWRTKQNLDYCFLMMYAQSKGTYYVQVKKTHRVWKSYAERSGYSGGKNKSYQ